MQWRRLGILLFAVIGAHLAAACGNGQTSGAGASSASSSSSGVGDSSTASSTGATTGSGASSSSSSATSSSSTGGAAPHHCVRGCTTAADCCSPGQAGCPSTVYPKNPTCDQGVCKPPQCGVDADCNFGTMMGYLCKLANGLKGCVQPCAMDTDCSGPATCSGKATDMSKYCAVVDPPCANDVDCGAGGKCLNSACVCAADAYCGGAGHCQSGDCVCTTDADCTGGFVNHCAP